MVTCHVPSVTRVGRRALYARGPRAAVALFLVAWGSACPAGEPLSHGGTGCIETGRTYPHVEITFRLPGVEGNPFEAEVWGIVTRPGGKPVRLAAFHDGQDIWRVRYTPDRPGKHGVRITIGPRGKDRPAAPVGLAPRQFDVNGEPSPGFVRVSAGERQRFVLDGGEPVFPIGYNVGWGEVADFEAHHRKMRGAGINWSRHWMAGFGRLQLDWWDAPDPLAGRLSLANARKWDRIVGSAEARGVRFQLVLQHHGQFSTKAATNWRYCPWNVANGGFLARPQAFFTNERARRLTRMKYRYVVARWGYSPAILAWELFNEVQFTDAGKDARLKDDPNWASPQGAAVAAWHAEMAALLRSLDPYRHLVTTSSGFAPDGPLGRIVDFHQEHVYREDMIAAAGRLPGGIDRYDKPVFYGEAGQKDPGRWRRREYAHSLLWAGLMSGGAGAAQRWSWRSVDGMLGDFQAASRFVDASGLARRHFAPLPVRCRCTERMPLTVRPGGGFEAPRRDVDVPTDGRFVAGLDELPAYLHGSKDKQARGMAGGQRFGIDAPKATTLSMTVSEVSRGGAAAEIRVDGEVAARKVWPQAEGKPPAPGKLTADIPAGRHGVEVRSVGADWFRVREYAVADVAPVLTARACGTGDAGVVWICSRRDIHSPAPRPVTGTVTVGGLKPGPHVCRWWHTREGRALRQEVVKARADGTLTLKAVAVAPDAAAYVQAKQ